MNAPNKDLFGNVTLIGLEVKLDRPVDRERPCCRNICRIVERAGLTPATWFASAAVNIVAGYLDQLHDGSKV
jgi:hypothetical protein